MSRPCPYCAQTDTRKDELGYCVKHDCMASMGGAKLADLVHRAKHLFMISRSGGQVGRVVSNPYSPRNRTANDIMYECTRLLGGVPSRVLAHISDEDRKPWDRNVRW